MIYIIEKHATTITFGDGTVSEICHLQHHIYLHKGIGESAGVAIPHFHKI